MPLRSKTTENPAGSEAPAQPADGSARVMPFAHPPGAPAPQQSGLVGAARRRYWAVILEVVVLCTAIGVVFGLSRAPEYQSESRLLVGTVSARVQAIPGYVDAAKSLASSYSRIGTTERVLGPVSAQTHVPIGEVRSRITVTPVVNNPLIVITATGRSAEDARRLNREVMNTLLRVVRRLGAADTEIVNLLDDYRKTSKRAIRASARLQDLKARDDRAPASVSAKELRDQESKMEALRLEANTLGTQYANARQARSSDTGIEVFDRPRDTANDRSQKLQQFGFVGFVGGAILGLAVAVALEARRRRRAAPPA
jgi:capsular polysaccharide biosynthesis protein